MTKPLEGLTVLDFSRVLAAPMATQILADLGASVIKIERPGIGDETRSFEPQIGDGESAYFFAFNRGKKSVTLDLRSAEGRDAVLSLVRTSTWLSRTSCPAQWSGLGWVTTI